MILIVAEHAGGKLAKSTLEMVTAARESGREGPVTLLVLGSGVAGVASEAARYAEQVLVGDLPQLAQYNAETWAAATAQIAQEGEASLVIIGGMKSISAVTAKLVPSMALVYVVACGVVIAVNFRSVPTAFGAIFDGAFSPEGVAGGVLGVMIIGFQRAAFSNEAGLGSASIAHSAVKTRHPVTEGFVAMLEPFIDTVVICTATALTIVIANTVSWQDQRAIVAETGELPAGGVPGAAADAAQDAAPGAEQEGTRTGEGTAWRRC